MEQDNINNENKCPVTSGAVKHSAGRGASNRDWWPDRLNINILRQHSSKSNPMDEDFNYIEEFKNSSFNAVKKESLRSDDRLSRIGGRQILGIMDLYSFVWHGIALVLTVLQMVVVVEAPVASVLNLSIAGLIMST